MGDRAASALTSSSVLRSPPSTDAANNSVDMTAVQELVIAATARLGKER